MLQCLIVSTRWGVWVGIVREETVTALGGWGHSIHRVVGCLRQIFLCLTVWPLHGG